MHGSPSPRAGTFPTVRACADACRAAAACEFFVYGQAGTSKQGECYQEHTRDGTCAEGWSSDEYDFYTTYSASKCEDEGWPRAGVRPTQLRSGVECASPDNDLGTFKDEVCCG